ncbi:hypothetical protein AAE478_003374 [Parahypoxylon ruwenzoriense]
MEAAESSELHSEPAQCERVGEAMPDIAGIGILLGFSVRAFILLALSIRVVFLTKLGRLNVDHPEGTAEHASEKRRLEMVSEILMIGNDLQMITVSYVFAILFLALTIFLEVRLDEWSLIAEELGYCYVTTGIDTVGASQPTTDKAYVAVTAVWLLVVMFGALFCSTRFRKPILLLSGLQFPLHLYMMIKLRLENQIYLEGEEDENKRDFGQTTATILLGLTIAELVRQGMQYIRFERALKKYGPDYVKNEDLGPASIVETGVRQVYELKKSMSGTRTETGGDVEQHEESHELMRSPEKSV